MRYSCVRGIGDSGDVIGSMASQGSQGVMGNVFCYICERKTASHFCKCTGAMNFFCVDCSSRHQAKYPQASHRFMPIEALEEYRLKSEVLKRAAAELRKNVERAERFSLKFREMMQQVIDHCVNYRTMGLQLLQTEIEELRACY